MQCSSQILHMVQKTILSMRMQNEVTNSPSRALAGRLMAATQALSVHTRVPTVTLCPPRAVGALSLCGGFAAAPSAALTHFPAAFLHSDRGPGRTSVTSQPTGFSISCCFDWKNVFSIYIQARMSTAFTQPCM